MSLNTLSDLLNSKSHVYSQEFFHDSRINFNFSEKWGNISNFYYKLMIFIPQWKNEEIFPTFNKNQWSG